MQSLKIGVAGKYFWMNGTMCQCGNYDYEIADGVVKIWNVVGANKSAPIINTAFGNITNVDTGAPFASQAALETWLAANFFFIASSGGGGGGTTINPTNLRLPIRTNATTFADSKILQDANGYVGVNQISPTTEKYQFCSHDNGTAFALMAAGSNTWGTYFGFSNSSSGKYWVLQLGGSGNTVAGTGVGAGNIGHYCFERNIGGTSGYRSYNFIECANGDNFFNPEYATGDQLNGKLGIGYRADATLPQRLSVSGGGYFSQSVGIGTPTPHASAILDLSSTTKGLGLTELTTAQINAIPSPKNGLTVFNTTLQKICFYTSTGWQQVTSAAM